MCPCRNVQQRGPTKQRTIPSISKSREEEIRKILRANLQKTRQRVGEATKTNKTINVYNHRFGFVQTVRLSDKTLEEKQGDSRALEKAGLPFEGQRQIITRNWFGYQKADTYHSLHILEVLRDCLFLLEHSIMFVCSNNSKCKCNCNCWHVVCDAQQLCLSLNYVINAVTPLICKGATRRKTNPGSWSCNKT